MKIDRPRITSAISGALGVLAVAVGLYRGRPLLPVLGIILIGIAVLSAVLSRKRTATIKESLVSRRRGPWLVFTLATLVGGLVAISVGFAAVKGQEVPLAIVLIPFGGVLLIAGALSLRYIVLLRRESAAVRAFGFESFDDYDRDRRGKGWDIDRIGRELGRSVGWIRSARRRYEGAESLRRFS